MGVRRRAVTVGALAAWALAAANASAAAPKSAVRVDQAGYASTVPKRAYLMSRVEQTGAPFTVQSTTASAPALSATVGASLGSWSKRYGHVYALDFDSVQTPGTYTVTVGGKAGASSPAFQIALAGSLYGAPLANALSFYENERDGAQYIPSPLRSAPAHLNDASASVFATPSVNAGGEFKGELTSTGETIDASGGWWDAGDYLKFVQTTSYTVDVLLAGVRDFPAQMGASSASANFTAEARFGAEWLLRMFDDRTRHALLPGGHRRGQLTDARRPRHLAPAAGRRYLRRQRCERALHPPAPGVPRGAAGQSDQPEPRRTRRRGVRAVLPGLPRNRACARLALPVQRRAHLRTRPHIPEGSSSDGDPLRLLPGERMARRPGARRHRAGNRAGLARHVAGGPRALPAHLLPGTRDAVGGRLHRARQARAMR